MKILSTLLLSMASFQALAAAANPVPEPGALSLLAVGAGAAALVWSRKHRK